MVGGPPPGKTWIRYTVPYHDAEFQKGAKFLCVTRFSFRMALCYEKAKNLY